MMHRQSDAAGFTLVELLVVLAIFSLMSLLLFDAFHFASHAATGGNARLARTRDFALAESFLRAQLADIRPFAAADQSDGRDVLFEGGPEGLDFIGAPPAYLAPGGFQELRIALEADSANKSLVIRWQPLRGGSTDARPLPPTVLLDGLARADFAYFGSSTARQAPDWHTTWSGAVGLPSLIRLKLTFRDGYAPPELIVIPRPAEPAFQ